MTRATVVRIWDFKNCAYPGCQARKVFCGDSPGEHWGGWSYMMGHERPDLYPDGFYCERHTELLDRVEDNPCEWCGVEPAVIIWPSDEGPDFRLCVKCDAAAGDGDAFEARRG